MCGIFGILFHNNENLDLYRKSSDTIRERGPERTNTILNNEFYLVFHRLAIQGCDPKYDQPFKYTTNKYTYYLMCNGEIYNSSHENDTSSIFPNYQTYDYDFTKLNKNLIGEYALSILRQSNEDKNDIKLFLSTDPLSVRPLFVGIKNGVVGYSSLLSGLTWCDEVFRLNGGEMVIISKEHDELKIERSLYNDLGKIKIKSYTEDQMFSQIVDTFVECVSDRLKSDREIGCLLSGGLDSSLVAAVSCELLKKRGIRLQTFSIGLEGSPDCYWAQKVAEWIGSNHTTVTVTENDMLSVLPHVMKTCETYDITTIRASVGQYLLGKYIKENTNIKVILNGDGSDELFCGYLYTKNAPTDESLQEDSLRLLKEIHLYDGLRVDRNISAHGLEARVPFLDIRLVSLVLSIPAQFKRSHDKIGKWLLRESFQSIIPNLLPDEVLYRKKEAFSDGVSQQTRSWFQIITDHVNDLELPDIDIENITHIEPVSKESQWYLDSFCKKFSKAHVNLIPHYWLPKWCGDVKDPSARILNVYTE